MIASKQEYEPSLRSSIASHGNDDLFLIDQQSSVLGLELATDPGIYKGPFASSGWHSSEPQIQQSPSVSSFVDKDSCSSARSHDRLFDPLDSATSAYFDPRSESEFPASSLPPNILPRSTRERNLKRLSQESVPQFVVPFDTPIHAPKPVRPPARPASAQGSRPPSIILSRPNSSHRVQRPPSRRSLAEEIADVGEEVPRSDLDDDSDDDVSWAAVLGGPSEDLDRFISCTSEQNFDRQRAAFPPPRSRTSSIISSRLPSRTPSFSGKSTFSVRSPISTPPLTPDPTRPKIHGRHSFHIEQLSAGSPSASLAPPSPLDVSPRRSNSISGLSSLRSLRGFRSSRRKGELELPNISVPVPGLLTAADLPSPVPELPNEPEGNGSKNSAPSSTHSRDSAIFQGHSRYGMAPTTPTRPGRPRMSLPKMPKVFRRSSGSHPAGPTLTTIETTEELAPNGDIIERTYTTTRRPSSSRHSFMSQISHPSPSGSTPATPGTPDHYVETNPLHYVGNTSRPASRPITPPPVVRIERKDIKPIMIVDYSNYPGPRYTPTSPPKAGGTPSRPTAPGPPVRSQPSTPNVVADVPPAAPVSPSPKVAAPAPATPAQVPPQQTKTHISVGSNASIDIATALSEGPAEAPQPPADVSAPPPAEIETAPAPESKGTTTIDIEVAKDKVDVKTTTGPKEEPAKVAPAKVLETPKAKTVEPPAPKGTTVNIDPKKGTVEVVTAPPAPKPEPAPKASEKSKAEEKKDKAKSPKSETKEIPAPTPQRSRSPSIRSVDARVRRSPNGEEVIVTLKSQRGNDTPDTPKEKTSKGKEVKETKEKDRLATFAQFDKPKSDKHVRPEHIKHHSVDSLRHSTSNHHLHAKQHSLDSPRYSRSVSYDAPSASHLNVSRSRMSSRRNSLESNASLGTIDSRGVARKRRVLNPMSVDSDSDSEAASGVEVEYNETDDAVNVKIKARVQRRDSSSDESVVEELDARQALRLRIQKAQRLMKENPRLPSEIDDIPHHPFPGPINVPPQHWPRPAPHPTLRPLYLGGRTFGAPVSTGMMPGLGYAAGQLGQLGHGPYLGMPGPVPMMLGRPPAPPGWYPRPRP